MRDIVFDFKRTFLGKYTLISSLIIILVAAGVAYLVASSGLLPKTSLDLAQTSFSEFGSITGALIPILAALSSYYYYGKDKVNSVLESVITLPVTRGRLIVTRYIANVSSMVLAFALGIGVYELILYDQIQQYLSLYYVSYLIWAFLVEIAGFTGLVYLASQFLKTQASILGFVIAVFVLYGWFWNGYIPYLTLYFSGISTSSILYTQYKLIFYALSPAGYSAFSIFLLAPASLSPTHLPLTISNAAQFGVTPLSIGLLGVGWMLLPILLAVHFGRSRD